MLTTETLKFVIGVLLAVLVTFSLWWFFVHNEADRRAEESAANFVNAVDMACEDSGNAKRAKIEMPQQGQLADLWKQFTPGGVGNEPYYYLFWESFPPEPPYDISSITRGDPLGTVASIFAPWSEDLPWNSNLWMTMAVDFVSLGVDVMGVKKVQDFVGGKFMDAGSKIKNYISGTLKRELSPETYDKLTKASKAIKNAADKVADFEGFTDPEKKFSITKDGIKILKKQAVYLTGETAAYTIFCMYYFDESLGKCATYSFVAAIGTQFVVRPLLQKFVLSEIKNVIKKAATGFINKAGEYVADVKSVMKFSSLKNTVADYTDETLDGAQQLLKDSGFVDEFVTDEATGEIYGLVSKRDHYAAIMKYAEENGWPDVLDNFQFVYDTTGPREETTVQKIKFMFSNWKKSIKSKINYPINKLGELEAKAMGHNIATPDGIIQSAESWSRYVTEHPDDAEKIAGKMGLTIEGLTKKLANFKEQGEIGSLFVTSIGSKLDGVLDICERDPEDCGRSFYDYFGTLADDRGEAKLVEQLLSGKRLRLTEDMTTIERSMLGYSLIKIQDLYTPLGATYWDKQMDYYKYGGRTCDDDEICLQMGFFVRKYQLPESCNIRGIENIKLKRGSMVASDPRFYLVSPCYAYVDVWVEGNTVWVKPLMCPNKDRNYCFATSGLVDWYVGLEITAEALQCAGTVICSAVKGALTFGASLIIDFFSILGNCLFGFSAPSECSLLGSALRTTVELIRESLLKYPDVYSLTKTAVGDLRGGYLWDGQC